LITEDQLNKRNEKKYNNMVENISQIITKDDFQLVIENEELKPKVGNAITYTMEGPGDFNMTNPLFDQDIENQFQKLMQNPKYQMLYQDLLKARKSHFLKWRQQSLQKALMEKNKEDRLTKQLPHIIITGFKKCGTKTLQHFFGFHPEIISGRSENPFQITGDAQTDMDAYLYMTFNNWQQLKTVKN